MIAFCGLTCDTCPIHLATLETDKFRQQTMRESIAELCTKQYRMNLQSEDITDCDGCRAGTGRLFSGCLSCRIRKCASRKNILNCAFCSDYACEILTEHFLHEPDAQSQLEKIRHSTSWLHGLWFKWMIKINFNLFSYSWKIHKFEYFQQLNLCFSSWQFSSKT